MYPFILPDFTFDFSWLYRQDVATFVNSYPTLDVSHKLIGSEYKAGSSIFVNVSLSRDADEEDESSAEETVVAPYYPFPKIAN